jgi:hypothetical protein
MISEAAVREWAGRVLALVDGVALDYIAVAVREGARSWPVVANVRADGRAPEEVVGELLAQLRDIGESAAANGRNGYRVRLLAYRSKMPAGSRTFASVGSQDPDADQVEESDGTVKTEAVALLSECRQIMRSQAEAMQIQGSKGWELALRLAAENAELHRRYAELTGELERARSTAAPDPMKEAAAKMIVAIGPDLVGMALQKFMAPPVSPES